MHGARYLLIAAVMLVPASVSIAQSGAPSGQDIVASAGDITVTRAELDTAVRQAARATLYHGTLPADQMHEFRRNTVRSLIEQRLLLREARRSGLTARRHDIEESLSRYRDRYANSRHWQTHGDTLEAQLSEFLTTRDLLQQLEARVREVHSPDDAELREYYAGNREKFVEPARHRVSLILLKVAPHESLGVWQATLARAAGLVAELRDGAEFAALARQHSQDVTAAGGGDMGYLHSGMLSSAAQGVIEELPTGAISDPIRLLDGIAVFQVIARTQPQQRPYDDVRDRVARLWQRERSELAWTRFKQELVSRRKIVFLDDSLREARGDE